MCSLFDEFICQGKTSDSGVVSTHKRTVSNEQGWESIPESDT